MTSQSSIFNDLFSLRDVNQAVDHFFSNGIQLAAPKAAAMSFNEAKAKEVFDGFKSTNEFGEICMEQDAIESWL